MNSGLIFPVGWCDERGEGAIPIGAAHRAPGQSWTLYHDPVGDPDRPFVTSAGQRFETAADLEADAARFGVTVRWNGGRS